MKTIRYSDTWLCSNGEKMLIEEMSSEHIQNCIKKIRKENFRKEWFEILEYELKLRRELDDLRFKLESSKREKKLREKTIDRHGLFGKPLSQSIQFLQELLDKNGDVILKEVWYGYEDNDFVLEYESDESDDEFRTRISMTLHFFRKKLERKYDERCVLEDKKRSLQQEMDDLDSQIKNTF